MNGGKQYEKKSLYRNWESFEKGEEKNSPMLIFSLDNVVLHTGLVD